MTARFARLFSFPLLAKELTEAAARRRTYVTRVLYAVLLYGLFAVMLPRWIWRPDIAAFQVMGAGHQLFETLIVLQLLGIALFLPALMCGRIAQEKERDSLVLLLLTELKPWRIVLEKYVGGLVPMLSFLLLGLPLAAIAYSLGGVTPWTLWGNFYALVVTALQVGAIALFCSAWCRTTVGAFLGTYFVGAAFYAGPPIVHYLIGEFIVPFLTDDTKYWRGSHRFSHGLIPASPVKNLISTIEAARQLGGDPRFTARLEVIWRVNLLMMLPSLLSIPFFLLLARLALVRRAFAPPANFLLATFRFFDAVMKRANHLVGGVMVIKERANLPGDAPIYWRETARRALGKVHYLLRIFVAVQIPVVFLCALAAALDYGGQADGLAVLVGFLAALATLTLSAQAANTIVSERVQQTLEVLLTTPLSGREIVLQKARALRRLALVVAIPLLTVFGAECYLEAERTSETHHWFPYLVCAISLLVVYLPLITWLSLWIGLRVRTRFRAIITALGTLVLWSGLPLVIFIAGIEARGDAGGPLARSILLLSPVVVGMLNESSDLHEFPWELGTPWVAILANTLLYGSLTLFIRGHALRHADRWLRR